MSIPKQLNVRISPAVMKILKMVAIERGQSLQEMVEIALCRLLEKDYGIVTNELRNGK